MCNLVLREIELDSTRSNGSGYLAVHGTSIRWRQININRDYQRASESHDCKYGNVTFRTSDDR